MDLLLTGNLELASKLIAVVMSAFVAYKVLDEIVNGKFTRMKQELDYFDKLIEACQENKHPLKIEKLFESLYGKRARAEIICHFVCDWPSPANGLYLYLRARDCLNFSVNSFIFDGKMAGEKYRLLMKILHVVVYGTFFSLAASLLIFTNISTVPVNKYPILIIYFVALLVSAFASLYEYWKIRAAENIVAESKLLAK